MTCDEFQNVVDIALNAHVSASVHAVLEKMGSVAKSFLAPLRLGSPLRRA